MRSVAVLCAVVVCTLASCATEVEVPEPEEEESPPLKLSEEDELAVDACVAAGLCLVDDTQRVPKKPPKPTQRQLCIAGCEGGTDAIQAFCRLLPNPALKAGCWAASYAGKQVCKGWCLWNFN